MLGVMIVPTGIGAEIGGHAGDANPAAKLMASCCDTLITHPNVLNASDINEMTENTLYVEGSMLDRFLEGELGLDPVRQNRVLVLANDPITPETVNAVNAARVTIGLDAEVLSLETSLVLIGGIDEHLMAYSSVDGWSELVDQVKCLEFDAVALHTPIRVERDIALRYYREGGANPWGAAEAKASRLISRALNKPVAHAPLELAEASDEELYLIGSNEVVDPRMTPEIISVSYLQSVLKGLHRAPKVGSKLSCRDVDFMVSPWGCWGRPHRACHREGIPIIMVFENQTLLDIPPGGPTINVTNYWEAAGVVMAMRAGVERNSVRRVR